MFFAESIFKIAKADPKRTALVIDGQDYSYGFLLSCASELACWLDDRQVKRLAFFADRTIHNYICMLAAVFSGRTYVPIHPLLPPANVEHIIKAAEIDWVWSDAQIDFKNRSITDWIEPKPVDPNATIYLLFTSGSTGKPKGVPVSYGNLQQFLLSMQNRHLLRADDRVAQYADLTFDMSVYDVWMAWQIGASLHVVPSSERLAPYKFINDHRITVWFSVPAVIRILRQLKLLSANCFSSLRLSLFSGEALLVKDASDWQLAVGQGVIENLYGPTEATVECLAHRFNHEIPYENEYVPIGQPFGENQVGIVDEGLQWILSNDTKGELLITGPQVISGYYQNDKLTQEKFIELHHPSVGKKIWYRTGDRVFRDRLGDYHYLNRLDYQVKIQGYRIELEEVEYHLRAVTKSSEVAAIVRIEATGVGKELLAVVSGTLLTVMEIKKELRQKLPEYAVPKTILIIETALPRNRNGKLDRQQLLSLFP